MIIKIEQNDGCKSCTFNSDKNTGFTQCYFQNFSQNYMFRNKCNLINKRIELLNNENGYVVNFLDKVTFKVKPKKCKICGSTNSSVTERHFQGPGGVDLFKGKCMCSYCFQQEMYEEED